MTQEYIGTKQVTAWEQEKDGKEGYAVKYEDGYISWSPKEVFEKTYIPVGHVQFLPPFHQRIIGEIAQLEEKIGKLEKFVHSDKIEMLPYTDQALLIAQLQTMHTYSTILTLREFNLNN